MQKLSEGIYIEDSYPGVTIGTIFQKNGTMMIDAPIRLEDARLWKALTLNYGRGKHQVLTILDNHFDRTIGARALDCDILAHSNTAITLSDRPSIFKGQTAESGSDWEHYADVIGTRWGVPNLTFHKQVKINFGGSEIILEHQPGPTNGATWVIIPDKEIIFIGDAVVKGRPPFLAEADIPMWIESLRHLRKEYKHYRIISGRGGEILVDDITFQLDFLQRTIKKLERLGKRNAQLKSIERLIPGTLKFFQVPISKENLYANRLRFGLSNYYIQHFQPQKQID